MAHGIGDLLADGRTVKIVHQSHKHKAISGRKNVGVMGSRRIFAPIFKLKVLDSYRNDIDCRGNQRATARKYGIHRRQIQKWLQVEENLRNSCAESMVSSNPVTSNASGNVRVPTSSVNSSSGDSPLSSSPSLSNSSSSSSASPTASAAPALNLTLARLHGDGASSPSTVELQVAQASIPSHVSPIVTPPHYTNVGYVYSAQRQNTSVDENFATSRYYRYDEQESENRQMEDNYHSGAYQRPEVESSCVSSVKTEVPLRQEHRRSSCSSSADSLAAPSGPYEIARVPSVSPETASHHQPRLPTNLPTEAVSTSSPLRYDSSQTHRCPTPDPLLASGNAYRCCCCCENNSEGESTIKVEPDERFPTYRSESNVVASSGHYLSRPSTPRDEEERHHSSSGRSSIVSYSDASELDPLDCSSGVSQASSASSTSSVLSNADPMARRRSFTVLFKLNVLDAFHSDVEVAGNQRATARKYGINRRQVQKWLGQETELRGEIALRGNSRQRLGPSQEQPGQEMTPIDLRTSGYDFERSNYYQSPAGERCSLSCCTGDVTSQCYQNARVTGTCYPEGYCYPRDENVESGKRPRCELSCCNNEAEYSPKRLRLDDNPGSSQPPQDIPLCLVMPKHTNFVQSTAPMGMAVPQVTAAPTTVSRQDEILFKPYLDNPVSKPATERPKVVKVPPPIVNNNCVNICNMNESQQHGNNYAFEFRFRVPTTWRNPYTDFVHMRSAFERYPTANRFA